jgi:S-adenosylmethionine hydrolase
LRLIKEAFSRGLQVRVITLTTDFGTRDWFVGTMKGVIAGIAPDARVIDLSHEIASGDICGGAFTLLSSYAFFPVGTVHVVVVDPGVGGARKPIAIKTSRFVVVGPDNGVLSWALRKEQALGVRVLDNPACHLRSISHTFHGRDIFSPVAAHLAKGIAFEELGSAADGFVKLDWPEPVRTGARVEGRVICIDRFGNGITNIPNAEALFGAGAVCHVVTDRSWTIPHAEYYSAVALSTPVLVPSSTGFLEIAVNGGSAEKALGLKRGSTVILELATRAAPG